MPTSWEIMSASAAASPQTYDWVQFGQGEWDEWDPANEAGVCAALCINWLLSDDKAEYAKKVRDSSEGEQARKDANILQTSLMAAMALTQPSINGSAVRTVTRTWEQRREPVMRPTTGKSTLRSITTSTPATKSPSTTVFNGSITSTYAVLPRNGPMAIARRPSGGHAY